MTKKQPPPEIPATETKPVPVYVAQVAQLCEVIEVDERKQVVTLKDLADNVFTIALPVYRHSFVPIKEIILKWYEAGCFDFLKEGREPSAG